MSKLEQMSELIESYVVEFGYTVNIYSSESSHSIFMNISTDFFNIESQEESTVEHKVRISDRVLPHKYSLLRHFIGFEVGRYPEADGEWFDCVAWLAGKIGMATPESIKQFQLQRHNYRDRKATDKMYAHAQRQFDNILSSAINDCKNNNHKLYVCYMEQKNKLASVCRDSKKRSREAKKLNELTAKIINSYSH